MKHFSTLPPLPQLSQQKPSIAIGESSPVAHSDDTAEGRVAHFFHLLHSWNNVQIHSLVPDQAKCIVQDINANRDGAQSRFFALCTINDANDRKRPTGEIKLPIRFLMQDDGCEMEIYQLRSNRLKGSEKLEEQLLIGSVPKMTFSDFDAKYPPGK